MEESDTVSYFLPFFTISKLKKINTNLTKFLTQQPITKEKRLTI